MGAHRSLLLAYLAAVIAFALADTSGNGNGNYNTGELPPLLQQETPADEFCIPCILVDNRYGLPASIALTCDSTHSHEGGRRKAAMLTTGTAGYQDWSAIV